MMILLPIIYIDIYYLHVLILSCISPHISINIYVFSLILSFDCDDNIITNNEYLVVSNNIIFIVVDPA